MPHAELRYQNRIATQRGEQEWAPTILCLRRNGIINTSGRRGKLTKGDAVGQKQSEASA